MDELVERLAVPGHEVVIGGPSPSVEELHHRLTEQRFVFVKFPGTNGGTDLGLRVDDAATDLSAADFTNGTGTVHIEGTLTLNFTPVRAVADVDLASLRGTGHLEAVDGVPA